MKQEGLSEWGKALWQEYLDENWKAMFKDGHDFELRTLNPVSREMEVARYNRDHPEQYTTIKYMSMEEAQKQYPEAKFAMGVDPYRTDGFEQFWLETDKFYEMVDESNVEVLHEVHPEPIQYIYAKRKVVLGDEFESFPSFGTGPEYTGMPLSVWLDQRGMRYFFNKRTATKLPLGFDNIPNDIIDLKVFKIVPVTGRGDIIALSLKNNGYKDATPKKVHDWFMNKLVTHPINGGWYLIHGIEMMGDGGMDYVNDNVGLLIKQWGVWHQLSPESMEALKKHRAEGGYSKGQFKLPK